MKINIYLLLLIASMSLHVYPHELVEEKPIVILITSYNNERWVEKNLNSVYAQKYSNYRVVYVDDCSSDSTYERVLQSIYEHDQQYRFTFIRNSERRNAMANFYTSIHMCKDNEIIVTLDGDDWFAHDQVLAYVNNLYRDPAVWLTYGRYQCVSNPKARDHNGDFPRDVIENNKFRGRGDFPVSHLRTHYAWLFKLIKLEDVLWEDYYFPMTSDYAMFLPMVEMASKGHFLPVHEILYMYNDHNPINDNKVNVQLQLSLGRYILNKRAYTPLQEPQTVEKSGPNDHISLIVFCDSQPSQSWLNTIREHARDLQALYLIIPQGTLNDLRDMGISYVTFTQKTLLTKLRSCLASCDSNYVLLTTDKYVPADDFDLQVCIALLKKTHTYIFYCGMNYNVQTQQLFNRAGLPLVSHEFPVYAWHANNRKGKWQTPVLDMTIWQKQLLQSILATIDIQSEQELKSSLDRYVQRTNKLGLMYKK